MNKTVSMVCHSNCFLVGCVLLLLLFVWLLLLFFGGEGGQKGTRQHGRPFELFFGWLVFLVETGLYYPKHAWHSQILKTSLFF